MGKIGRNEQCPCGSGKKFKRCHLGQSDEDMYTGRRQASVFNRTIKKIDIKECIFVDNSQCSGKIIKAHSIQNNGVLSKLAIDGHVLMPKMDYSSKYKVKLERVGKNEASIFTGFCKKHDNEIFQEIDDEIFSANDKQLFLLAYRSFAKEYFSKKEATHLTRKLFGMYPQRSQNIGLIEKAILPQELSIQDNETDRKKFDDAFINNSFSILENKIFYINNKIGFAVSSMFELDYDLEGTEIYDRFDYSKENKPPKLFVNIFPDVDCSYIIISCFRDEFGKYNPFFNQLQDKYENDKKIFYKIINNMIVKYCENIVLSPRLIEVWGSEKKEAFLKYYTITGLEQMIPDDISPVKSLFVNTPFNLFDPLPQ